MLRTEQRRAAVWALYQSDLLGKSLDEAYPRDVHRFTRALAQLVRDRQAELDELISTHASGWSLNRIAPLERSILRVGLVEMLHPEQIPGDQPIPPEGAIDEAVETAKQFCGADAPAFVNGILGAVLREREARPGERGAVPGEGEPRTIRGSTGGGGARLDARSG